MKRKRTNRSATVLVKRGGWLEGDLEQRSDARRQAMAAKKTKKKGTRKSRGKGELPANLNSERVLQALSEWDISKAEFVKAYDATAKPRGRAATPLTAAQKKVAEDYFAGELDKEEAMKKAGTKTPGAFLNFLERAREQE